MQHPQVATVTGMMEAVNAGDAKRYALAYTKDAVIVIYGSAVLRGRDAIERYEVELLREFPGARLAFHAMWQAGPAAVVRYAVTGQGPAGRWMGHEGLLFYRFDASGIVQQEHRYLDSLTPMAQKDGATGPLLSPAVRAGAPVIQPCFAREVTGFGDRAASSQFAEPLSPAGSQRP